MDRFDVVRVSGHRAIAKAERIFHRAVASDLGGDYGRPSPDTSAEYLRAGLYAAGTVVVSLDPIDLARGGTTLPRLRAELAGRNRASAKAGVPVVWALIDTTPWADGEVRPTREGWEYAQLQAERARTGDWGPGYPWCAVVDHAMERGPELLAPVPLPPPVMFDPDAVRISAADSLRAAIDYAQNRYGRKDQTHE